MHDAVKMERKGVPAIVLIHDRFANAARAQAKIMGLSSIKIIVIPEGIPEEKPEQIRARIDNLWDRIASGLMVAQP